MGAGAAINVCVRRAACAGAGVVCALHDLAQRGEFSLASALEPVEAGLGETVAGEKDDAEWQRGEGMIRSCLYCASRAVKAQMADRNTGTMWNCGLSNA